MADRRGAAVLIILALLASASALDAKCESFAKKKKPLKVRGVVCGSVFSGSSYDFLPGAELALRDSAGVTVAKTRADANGRFQFPAVPKGLYRVASPGWFPVYDQLQVTSSTPSRCREAVAVYLELSGCSGSRLSKSWPRPY